MTYQSPYERRLDRRRVALRLTVIALLLLVCLWLDGPVYRLLSVQYTPTAEAGAGVAPAEADGLTLLTPAQRKARLESKDWYQMFRAAGYLPTWFLIGGGVWLVERSRRRPAPGGLAIIAGAVLAGLGAEILKPLLGRHRPAFDGSLEWNPVLGRLLQPETYDAALGLPSSHAAVAFGAAFVVVRLYRPARWILVVAASGCALTRLLAGAHVLSDVVVAALVAWVLSGIVVGALMNRVDRPRAIMRFD